MIGFLILGFLIGMSHALEADHLSAISTMMSDAKGSKKRLAFRGATWGLGHTITLFAICTAVILFGATLTVRMTAILEFSVGMMLIILGLDVYRRFRKKKLHFHGHQHDAGPKHIHAHSHKEAKIPHVSDSHLHEHPNRFPLKAFAIGLVHGAAGSAGLLALAVAATQSVGSAILYILAFGVGSILGMAALTYTVAWPLAWVERGMGWMHTALNVTSAGLAIAIGSYILTQTGPTAWGVG
jgi:cytochrome c biogenesis protein CcdA